MKARTGVKTPLRLYRNVIAAVRRGEIGTEGLGHDDDEEEDDGAGGEIRVAFVSDIHSNLEALEAVLDAVRGLKIYCCGDIVGYGASPNEVVRLLRELHATCVVGNHDHAAIEGNVAAFNPRAAMAALWTARRLSGESRDFLSSLPREVSIKIGKRSIYMTHGSPDDPMWEYVRPSTHADLFDYYLQKVHADVMALGHTHLAFEWQSHAIGGGTVVNPGSVGQPRSGDRRASYAILTIDGGGHAKVDIRQIEYDVERAAKKVLDSGLPPSLANQLLTGG